MKRTNRPKLYIRIILFALSLILLIVLLCSILYYHTLSKTVEQQISKRALHVATTIANMPEIHEAFDTEDPSRIIQPLVEKIRVEIGAEYIVIGNKEGIRYSHPIPERIGKKMVGGDNVKALKEGKSYVSKATGSLGPSLRGKVPILDGDEIIGVVSVGFLIEDIENTVFDYGKPVIWIAITAFLLGTLGSIILARRIKNTMMGLEPEEIATLFKQRNAVIETVHEGIIVINEDGKILIINQAAYDILSLDKTKPVVGEQVFDIIPNSSLLDVLRTGEKQLDKQLEIRNKIIIANRIPVKYGDEVIGVVSSFRLKSDIDQLTEELSQVKRYTEALRAQTHEFNNLLYTISGLIQLGSLDEALTLIHEETESQRDFTQFLMRKIKDPWLGGILLGFYNRAKELKVTFHVDRESSLEEIPKHIGYSSLVSILGNLITNGFEELEKQKRKERYVRFFITDLGDDLIMEIEDSGTGVEPHMLSEIFKKGFSTKDGKNRGLGLAKVSELVEELNGSITIETGELGGALFIIAIPKEEPK
ncbi:sensor histidine kinase [Metabacillus litoralis]|uniref:ATP-binding protein n=1 Tax=Metabacillus TaxID=2675233 RepID=UPI001E64EBA7|nr:sensor histidine kinase [Metabacillus litoralis]UHA61764.1 sensor histidine kinase [Metabacillus litoralis]